MYSWSTKKHFIHCRICKKPSRMLTVCYFYTILRKKRTWPTLVINDHILMVSSRRVHHSFLRHTASASLLFHSNCCWIAAIAVPQCIVSYSCFSKLLLPSCTKEENISSFSVICTEIWHFLHFCDLQKSNFMINTKIQDRPQQEMIT